MARIYWAKPRNAKSTKTPNMSSRFAVRFMLDGRRRTVSLGRLTRDDGNRAERAIADLVKARRWGTPYEDRTARWLAACPQSLVDRLVGTGLIEHRGAPTLGSLIDEYIARHSDVSPATRITYLNTRRNLVEYFGEGKLYREITAFDMQCWAQWLATHEGLAVNSTCRKRASIAKQFFKAALDDRRIECNPAAKLRVTVEPNEERFYFVTRDEAARVLATCPDAEWRLVFALSRFGGLRCPSEHVGLRWKDIDWEARPLPRDQPQDETLSGRRIAPGADF